MILVVHGSTGLAAKVELAIGFRGDTVLYRADVTTVGNSPANRVLKILSLGAPR